MRARDILNQAGIRQGSGKGFYKQIANALGIDTSQQGWLKKDPGMVEYLMGVAGNHRMAGGEGEEFFDPDRTVGKSWADVNQVNQDSFLNRLRQQLGLPPEQASGTQPEAPPTPLTPPVINNPPPPPTFGDPPNPPPSLYSGAPIMAPPKGKVSPVGNVSNLGGTGTGGNSLIHGLANRSPSTNNSLTRSALPLSGSGSVFQNPMQGFNTLASSTQNKKKPSLYSGFRA